MAHAAASQTLAQKAIGFGFEGVQVDGNDVLAVYEVFSKALDKALSGGGPTLIEAVTYRRDNHTTADDWKKYRSEEEVKSWSSSNLPKTKAWWKEAKNIIEQDRLDSEVGESAYYINLSIASPEAAKRLMGKNWKTIFVGDHHTYGLNGPPWDSHKA